MKLEEMIAANRANCNGCEACASVCPKDAIYMLRDAEGFAYPMINRELCDECGKCDSICPALNANKKNPDALPKVFAAVNRDEKIRRHSSSGGVFTALSEIILREGGVVFGAGFDKNFHVMHTAARTLDALEKLRGSKYVQSQIGEVYRHVRAALKSSSVLFSGTPCQCAGLKNFLGDDPENLLTVDVICKGVSSPALWKNYIGELSHAHEVTHVNFRSKKNGWSVPHVEINFSDQGHYLRPLIKDIFGKNFLCGVSNRPSCHACKFKFPNGKSDLTLGDAWGVQNFAPEIFDNRGASLVFIHTDKGKNFFKRTNLIVRPVHFADTLKNNPALIISLPADPRRKNFFDDTKHSNDKFAVMQQYAYQDDKEIRRQVDEQNQRALTQNYQKVAAQIRQRFKKNILLVSGPLDKNALEIFGNFIEQNFPQVGAYLLRPLDNERLLCTENFSSLNFTLKDTPADLSAFARDFNIASLLVEQPTRFDSPVLIEWIKYCGLPTQTITRNK